jgi:hypothetical protein
MSVASQDTYLNLTTPLTVIGSGGGGTVPANLVVSTLTLGASTIVGVSSINGASYPPAAGAVPANLVISTLTLGASTINGVSSINGAAYPPAGGAVPANLAVSSLTFNVPGSSAVFTGSSFGANSTLSLNMVTGGIKSFIEMQPANGTVAGDPYTEIGLNETSLNQGGSVKIYRNQAYVNAPSTIFLQSPTVEVTGGEFSAAAIIGVSSINSAAYPPAAPALPANATFSTVQISTVQTPVAASSATAPTFNTVLGGMRMQGGVVAATVAGSTINWGTAFTTVPIVTTGLVEAAGASTIATVTGASETQVTLSVNLVGGGGTVPVYYLAIGAA